MRSALMPKPLSNCPTGISPQQSLKGEYWGGEPAKRRNRARAEGTPARSIGYLRVASSRSVKFVDVFVIVVVSFSRLLHLASPFTADPS